MNSKYIPCKVFARSPGGYLRPHGFCACTYIGAESASSDLCLIVKYFVRHYILVWFHIRNHSKCTECPGNLLFSLQLLRDLPQPLPKLLRSVFQRNA